MATQIAFNNGYQVHTENRKLDSFLIKQDIHLSFKTVNSLELLKTIKQKLIRMINDK